MANKKISAAGPLIVTAVDTDQLEIERATGASGHLTFATLIAYIKDRLKVGTAQGIATLDLMGTLTGAQIPASLKSNWIRDKILGVPPVDSVIFGFIPGVVFALPLNLVGSRITCRLPPSAPVSLKLYLNDVQIGTATFPSNATEAAIATTGAISMLAADRFTAVSPLSVNADIHDIYFAINGVSA